MTREELVQMREYKVAQASTEYWNKNKDNDEVGIITAFEEGVAWADESLLEKLSTIDCALTSRLHNIWHGIKQRCNNPRATGYKLYGGKGVKVCDAWEKNYILFVVWALLNGYSDELSIDRIDSNGNQQPPRLY